jgi:hypothetical protein
MKSVVIRDRQSGGNTEIYPIFEDTTHWYVLENRKGKNFPKIKALRYSKFDFDFMGEK